MRLRLSSLVERFRASLFVIPMAGVLVALGLGTGALLVDSSIDAAERLPLGVTSTVESARTLLSTVAAATMTFAGIAFSVSLLVLQNTATQYSPRVVHTLFRDPFNKGVMALVVGTFTYCVVVLRSVRSPLEEGGDPVIPHLSVTLAVVLGIATILSIVAFINHSAHTMDVSEVLHDVQADAIEQVCREWSPTAGDGAESALAPTSGDDELVVRVERSGWVQQLDVDGLLTCLPDGTRLVVETFPGRHVLAGAPLYRVSPAPNDDAELVGALRGAVSIGRTRTMQQDTSYGIRQLADVALKALSPGINDPTTARDAIHHSGALLAVMLRHDPPPDRRRGDRGQEVVLPLQPTHDELVDLAFAETRRAAAGHPSVCETLLEVLGQLRELLTSAGLGSRTAALHLQAQLVVAGCEAAEPLPADLVRVQAVHRRTFPEVT